MERPRALDEGKNKGCQLAQVFPARLDWPSLIGNFILNFGTLEHLVFTFLKDHLPENDFQKCRSWHLQDRLLRIQKHMVEAQYPEDRQAAFSRFITDLSAVREIRNDLAHSHLLLSLHPNTGAPLITLFNPKNINAEAELSLTFDELNAARVSLSKLIGEASILLTGSAVQVI